LQKNTKVITQKIEKSLILEILSSNDNIIIWGRWSCGGIKPVQISPIYQWGV